MQCCLQQSKSRALAAVLKKHELDKPSEYICSSDDMMCPAAYALVPVTSVIDGHADEAEVCEAADVLNNSAAKLEPPANSGVSI